MKRYFSFLFFICFSHAFAQESDVEARIEASFYKGYNNIYTQKDSAYYYFDEAYALANDINDYETLFQILSYKIFTNGYHYDMKRYRKNLDVANVLTQIDSIASKTENYHIYKEQLLFDTGNYYYKLKDYTRAKPFFIELYKSFATKGEETLSPEDVSTLLSVYNFLASIYKNTSKYDLAELYYNKAKTLSREIYEGDDLLITLASTDKLLAQLYNNMGELEKANGLLNGVLEIYELVYAKDKKYKNNLISVYQTLVQNCIESGSYDKAIDYLKRCENIRLPQDPFYKKSLLLYGDIYSKLNEDKKALNYFNLALEAYEDYHQSKSHQDVAEVYGKLSEFYWTRKDFKTGLAMVNQALKSASEETNLNTITASRVFSKKQFLNLLDLKNKTLLLAYEQTKDFEYLKKALAVNETILETFTLLKREFESKLDKQFLSKTVFPIFSRMMGITFEAYLLDPKTEFIELAMNISEKNKDILLLDAFRDVNATNFKNVPERILDQEATYKSEINITEKTIFNTNNSEQLKVLNHSLFKLKDNYYQFLDSIAITYPEYYNLKFEEKALTLARIKSTILEQKNQMLVSYTLTDGYLYTIAINDNKEAFLRVPFSDNIRDKITYFYADISKSAVNGQKKINTAAKELYKFLVQNIMNDFKDESIIFIPDGVLHYLPFELLIDSDGNYLLSTKRIRYNSSASSLIELQNKRLKNEDVLLAYAPTFEEKLEQRDERFKLGPLLHNKNEVYAIKKFFRSNIVVDEKATLDHFKTVGSNHSMIHLATHASANDEFPDYSYLAFTASDSASSTLYIKDLYNTQINADMVTLSACQTGIGKLRKGEGMTSLSKGFYYAGAKSLVKSLWKINDKSTAKLMSFFYEELSEGKSKDEALRQAKLKYLESTNDDLLKHPYYWAAFVVSGDVSPVSVQYYWWYITAFVILAIVFFAFFRKKRLIN